MEVLTYTGFVETSKRTQRAIHGLKHCDRDFYGDCLQTVYNQVMNSKGESSAEAEGHTA